MPRMTSCLPDQTAQQGSDRLQAPMDEKYESDKGIGAFGIRDGGFRRNARPPVITAPTGGSAGVMPSLVYALGGPEDRSQKVRDGMLAALASVTSASTMRLGCAEGGAGRDRRGVVDGGGIGRDCARRRITVVENATESALNITYDPRPVAGYAGSCIERCAFGESGRLHTRSPATRLRPAPRRFRRNRDGPGPNCERHEQQVQGNQRSWPRPTVTLC